jgi:hypothetical protein
MGMLEQPYRGVIGESRFRCLFWMYIYLDDRGGSMCVLLSIAARFAPFFH